MSDEVDIHENCDSEIERLSEQILRLRAKLAAAQDALEIIAGIAPPFDYLLGNADHAEAVLKVMDKMKGPTYG